MRTKYAFPLAAALGAVVMEGLPYGAVCNFAAGPGETIRKTFSYFSLTPFGYANFGPLVTAALTVLVAVLILLTLILRGNFGKAALTLCVVAVITSLSPLTFGVGYYSWVGLGITVLLAVVAVLLLVVNARIARQL